MKHLIKSLLLTMLVALVSISASAADYDFEVDGVYYNVLSFSDLTCEVTSGDTKYNGDVKIPSTVTYNGKTLSVTSIGEGAFSGCTNLTSIDIPNSVTSIGDKAFYSCESLTSITIPNSVTSIGRYAFHECTSLTSIDIPNSVTSIGNDAFSGCASLTLIDIPNSVTSIGYCAFEGCTSLTSIEIPNGVTSIGDGTFYGCTSLTSIDIPNSVTSIGGWAFKDCTSLTSIDIPNSVTSIGRYAFYGCASLTSIDIPNSVTSIGSYTFYKCTSLTTIDIPNSVTSIGESAFRVCTSLTSIDIPNSVTSIEENAFSSCTSLTQIEIGNRYAMRYFLRCKNDITSLIISEDYSDKSIPTHYIYDPQYGNGYYIHSNENLKTFICKMATPVELEDYFSNAQYMNLEVIVPTESLALYQAADVWKNFWNLKGGAEKYMTGISNVTVDKANKPDVIYDLQGRKLSKPQKGINIINGKKVVVK